MSAQKAFSSVPRRRDADQPAVVELEVEVGGQAQVQIAAVGGGDAELAIDVPGDLVTGVVGRGVAVELDLAVALGTVDRADEHPARAHAAAAGVVARRADDQRVADDDPAGLGRPGRLDHVRAGLVAAGDGDALVGPEAEAPGAAVEDRRRRCSASRTGAGTSTRSSRRRDISAPVSQSERKP